MKSVIDVFRKYKYILTARQKKLSIGILILSFGGALVEMVGVSVIIPLVQVLVTPESLEGLDSIEYFKRMFGLETYMDLTIFICIGVIILYLLKNIYLVVLSYVRVKFSCSIQKEISIKLLRSYVDQGYTYFTEKNPAELFKGINDNVSGVYLILNQVFKIIAEAMTVVSICAYILFTDWIIAVTVGIIAVICLILMIFCFKKQMTKHGDLFYKYAAKAYQCALQLFNGIREVLVFDKSKFFIDKYKESYEKKMKAHASQIIATEIPAYVIEAICITGLIAALCVKVSLGDSSALLIPQLASYAVAAFRILPSLGRMSSSMNQIVYNIPSLEATYQNILKAEESAGFTKEQEKENDCGKEISSLQDKIELSGVNWIYEEKKGRVLDDLKITFKKGTSTALVGKSGAGKSTLVDIILGLLKPNEGKFYIDKTDVLKENVKYGGLIGFVPQSVYLLDDSIRKNIAFGLDDNEIDEEHVWSALEQAQLKEFVKALPEQLETMIGERGVLLSGGQRQRLAIARALYREPEVLILDEATSALDNETEYDVMKAIEALQGKKTLIIVAHRLTTIENCDYVYEIVDGRAVSKVKSN